MCVKRQTYKYFKRSQGDSGVRDESGRREKRQRAPEETGRGAPTTYMPVRSSAIHRVRLFTVLSQAYIQCTSCDKTVNKCTRRIANDRTEVLPIPASCRLFLSRSHPVELPLTWGSVQLMCTCIMQQQQQNETYTWHARSWRVKLASASKNLFTLSLLKPALTTTCALFNSESNSPKHPHCILYVM